MRKSTSREERESSLASGWTVSGDETPAEGGDAVADGSALVDPAAASPDPVSVGASDGAADGGAEEDGTAELSNGALVLLGVLGGLFLLYAWIWLSWAQFYAEMNAALAEGSGSLGSALQQALFWAAPAAPILWFLTALLLNRGAGMRRVMLWLVVGAIVLLPYPIFSGGGAS